MSTITVRGSRVMWVEIRGCTGVCRQRIEDLPWTLVEMARAGEETVFLSVAVEG